MLYYVRKVCLVIFVALTCYSYFSYKPYKAVNEINPEALSNPVQIAIQNPRPIKFIKDGYQYTLHPLYDYTITGLNLHTQLYDQWFSLSRTDKTFIKDVCVIWGENLSSKAYQDSSFSVKQDFRFCLYNWYSDKLVFNANELSNNHLIASTPKVEKIIRSMRAGDQIMIKGKLVNVETHAVGETQEYEHKNATWTTSTTREDSGAGACEIIYVTEARILKRVGYFGSPLLIFSLIGLSVMIVLYLVGYLANKRAGF
jgi:hypothetical protein